MKLRTARRPRMPQRPPQRQLAAKTLRARAATMETADDEYYDEQEPSMKLSHAFIVILILHIIALGGIFGFSTLKAKQIAGAQSTKSVNSIQPETSDSASQQAPANATDSQGQGAGPQASPPAPVRQIAAAPAGSPAPAPHVKAKTHTVASGETLTKIAKANGVTARQLEKANGLTSTSSLRVGQVLKIPTPGSTVTAPAAIPVTHTPATTADSVGQPVETAPQDSTAPAAKSDDAPAGAGGTYTVGKGDNPYKIAKKLHVNYEELLKANNITDPKKLQIGQKLIVPAKKSANASQ